MEEGKSKSIKELNNSIDKLVKISQNRSKITITKNSNLLKEEIYEDNQDSKEKQ